MPGNLNKLTWKNLVAFPNSSNEHTEKEIWKISLFIKPKNINEIQTYKPNQEGKRPAQ